MCPHALIEGDCIGVRLNNDPKGTGTSRLIHSPPEQQAPYPRFELIRLNEELCRIWEGLVLGKPCSLRVPVWTDNR